MGQSTNGEVREPTEHRPSDYVDGANYYEIDGCWLGIIFGTSICTESWWFITVDGQHITPLQPLKNCTSLRNSDQRLRHVAVQVDPMHWLQDAMVQVECGWPSQASQASHAAVQVDPVPVDPADPGEDPEAQEPTEPTEATEAAEAAEAAEATEATEATEAAEAAEAAEATEPTEAAEAAPEPRAEDGEDGEDVTPGHSSQEPKQPADQEPAEFSHEAGVEVGIGKCVQQLFSKKNMN